MTINPKIFGEDEGSRSGKKEMGARDVERHAEREKMVEKGRANIDKGRAKIQGREEKGSIARVID